MAPADTRSEAMEVVEDGMMGELRNSRIEWPDFLAPFGRSSYCRYFPLVSSAKSPPPGGLDDSKDEDEWPNSGTLW